MQKRSKISVAKTIIVLHYSFIENTEKKSSYSPFLKNLILSRLMETCCRLAQLFRAEVFYRTGYIFFLCACRANFLVVLNFLTSFFVLTSLALKDLFQVITFSFKSFYICFIILLGHEKTC